MDSSRAYRDVTANPNPLPHSILDPSRWDRFTPRLRQVCDTSLGPGTGLAQRDRSQGLPACEASATRAPTQHPHRGLRSHVTSTIPQACDILDCLRVRTARRQSVGCRREQLV
jgi:hypothetical protein